MLKTKNLISNLGIMKTLLSKLYLTLGLQFKKS